MSLFRCLTLALCISFAAEALAVEAAPSAAATEAKQLFNGEDLTGWEGDPRLWTVKDGVIRGETTKEKVANGNSFLIWQGGPVKDFELRVTFRGNAANNSGIQYRSKHITDKSARNKWVVRGYQHELRNENKLPNVSGFIYDEGGRRGRICLVGEKATWESDGKKHVSEKLIDADAYQELFKLNDWNEVKIVAKGNRIQHYCNGTLVLDFTDNDPKLALSEGVIALQLHAGAPMWVEFKEVSLRDLSETK